MSTTHKLTAQMVAAYPNAMVIETETGDMYDVLCVHGKFNSINVQLSNSEGISDVFSFVQTSHFQLVLTSPDKITDVQALVMAKGYCKLDKSHTVKAGRKLLESLINLNEDWAASSAVELADICRSLNIDMGYRNIPSLIAVGLAVEAKEVGNE